MNRQASLPTLTFLSYADFRAEIARRGISEVRMESGSRDENRGAPGPWRNYIITLTT